MLLVRNKEFLRSKDKAAWIQNNIEAVTILILTILTAILLAMVIHDPDIIYLFKNPKTEPIWKIKTINTSANNIEVANYFC